MRLKSKRNQPTLLSSTAQQLSLLWLWLEKPTKELSLLLVCLRVGALACFFSLGVKGGSSRTATSPKRKRATPFNKLTHSLLNQSHQLLKSKEQLIKDWREEVEWIDLWVSCPQWNESNLTFWNYEFMNEWKKWEQRNGMEEANVRAPRQRGAEQMKIIEWKWNYWNLWSRCGAGLQPWLVSLLCFLCLFIPKKTNGSTALHAHSPTHFSLGAQPKEKSKSWWELRKIWEQ